MKFIVENKVFDTEKAEVICEFKERKQLIWNKSFSTWEYVTLYRTNKGNWFSVIERLKECTQLNNIQVEELLKGLDEVELYEKYFEKLEEA